MKDRYVSTAMATVLLWVTAQRPFAQVSLIPVWQFYLYNMLIVVFIYEHVDPITKKIIGYSVGPDEWPRDPDYFDGYY